MSKVQCAVCGMSDVQTTNKNGIEICDVCVSMEAVPEGDETTCKYDPIGDKYYKDRKHVVIGLPSGEKFDTRTDLVEFLKELKANV